MGNLTARTSTSDMSLKSHPPPKDEKWARWKYEMKKKYGPVYEKRIGTAHAACPCLLVVYYLAYPTLEPFPLTLGNHSQDPSRRR